MRENCIEDVADSGGFYFHKCTNPIWKDGYCKIHHPESVKKRQEKSEIRWKEKKKIVLGKN